MSRLKLETKEHPVPYRLNWLNEQGTLLVKSQATIEFSIGKFKDQVTCDVVPLDACHILLGRPWQYDRQTVHDGRTNKISLQYQGKRVTLLPMTP